MKNKVLSCLGRRKRDSSQTEADFGGGGSGAVDPATRRDHRVGKLPRDEVVSAAAEHREAPGGFETPSGLEDNAGAARGHAVSLAAACAPGLEARSEVSGAGCDASDPPQRAMEDQPPGGTSLDRFVSGQTVLTGTGATSAPTLTRDPDPASDRGLSEADEANMTKTEREATAAGDQNNCSLDGAESQQDSAPAQQSPPPSGFTGTIPKLIITRDPSPVRAPQTPPLLTVPTELGTGSCLDPHPEDESPCSDSGCGGSPALMRSPRKLSNSSSIGLSSASSFEESEDDFTGSDIESSLSPARSLYSPEDGTGVSVSTCLYQHRSFVNIAIMTFLLKRFSHNKFIYNKHDNCSHNKS